MKLKRMLVSASLLILSTTVSAKVVSAGATCATAVNLSNKSDFVVQVVDGLIYKTTYTVLPGESFNKCFSPIYNFSINYINLTTKEINPVRGDCVLGHFNLWAGTLNMQIEAEHSGVPRCHLS